MSGHPSDGPQTRLFTQQVDWTRSDEYHNSFLVKPDSHLASTVKNAQEGGLPDIAVSEAQGKFLNLLARSVGAKRIVEVGTLGGYSTIWLAKAVPEDGQVITCEVSKHHAAVAQSNIDNAGLSSKVQILVGPAVETLPTIPSSSQFDLAFIDADKTNNLNYFKEAERLVKPGGVIIVDNVVRHGLVADENLKDGEDESVDGVRNLLRYLKEHKTIEATTLATVGTKGYDGLLYAVKQG